LPAEVRAKALAIMQSARCPGGVREPVTDAFEVCVVGHLREVKDPFRAALAARMLPASSRVRVLQIGEALTSEYAERARAEERENPRYRWLGGRSRLEALRTLASTRLMVLTSRLEGGANVIS